MKNDQKCMSVFVWTAGYSWQILMELEFSRQFRKKKILKYKISLKNHPVGAELSHVGGQDEANSHFFAVLEMLPKTKSLLFSNTPCFRNSIHLT